MKFKSLIFFLQVTIIYSNIIDNCDDLCQSIKSPSEKEIVYKCGTFDVKELDNILNKLFNLFRTMIPLINETICIEEIYFKDYFLIRCFDTCNNISYNIINHDLNKPDKILKLNNTKILSILNYTNLESNNTKILNYKNLESNNIEKEFNTYLNELFNLSLDTFTYFINKICLNINLEMTCFI